MDVYFILYVFDIGENEVGVEEENFANLSILKI